MFGHSHFTTQADSENGAAGPSSFGTAAVSSGDFVHVTAASKDLTVLWHGSPSGRQPLQPLKAPFVTSIEQRDFPTQSVASTLAELSALHLPTLNVLAPVVFTGPEHTPVAVP